MRWGSTLVSAWIPAFAGMTGRGQGCEVPRLRRERRTLSQGSDGWGLIPGPIWPCLASFTPTVEAGNGATVASFGPQLTRTRRPAWPCFDCGGLITSGQERQTFNSLPFASISTHCLSSEPSPSWIPAFAGMTEGTAATRRRGSHPRRGTALRSA